MSTSKSLYIATLLVLAILATSIQGQSTHAAVCDWVSNGNNIYYPCGNVGIGPNVTDPGERLHIGDGNLLIEGGGETALKIKEDVAFTGGPSGVSQNPIFQLGRIIQAGDGDPEIRMMYSDDITLEHAVFEVDRKGIVASVKQGRGSHFEGYVVGEENKGSHLEGFISGKDPEPIFRLNSWPKMRLEMGDGGSSPVDVAIQREMTNTLTFITGTTPGTERLRIDSTDVAVSSGYLKLDTSSGPPPHEDCNNDGEIGRMTVDASSRFLYVCTKGGWGETFLSTAFTFLAVIHR